MDQKKRKGKLVPYLLGIIVSLLALYVFLFVLSMAAGWKIFWVIISLGWLFTAVTGAREALREKQEKEQV